MCDITVMIVVLCGVVVVMAVVVLHGVVVTIVTLCGATVVIVVIAVGGWAMVGPGGRGQLCIYWQGGWCERPW